jgi:5'-methylthioadenosine phosphorylase
MSEAEIGVFGGSGFYEFLEDAREVEVETPFGHPSAPLTIGEIAGKPVAFMPRHGRRHEWPPHRIPYRANVWAMRQVGVRRLLGPCASGALRADFALGEFVIADQFVDRTWGRADTFYDGPCREIDVIIDDQFVDRTWGRGDTFYDGSETVHVSAADPYCPELRRLLVETARELGIPVREGGTVAVVQGPRFSTRAESRWFQGLGWDVINMTAYPEGHLARELELCYANVSMVTDYDVGVEGGEAVTADRVVQVFRENNDRLRELLFAAIPRIGPQPEDVCATALRGAQVG